MPSVHVPRAQILVCVLRTVPLREGRCAGDRRGCLRTRGADAPPGSGHRWKPALAAGPRGDSIAGLARIFMPRWRPRGGMAGSPEEEYRGGLRATCKARCAASAGPVSRTDRTCAWRLAPRSERCAFARTLSLRSAVQLSSASRVASSWASSSACTSRCSCTNPLQTAGDQYSERFSRVTNLSTSGILSMAEHDSVDSDCAAPRGGRARGVEETARR